MSTHTATCNICGSHWTGVYYNGLPVKDEDFVCPQCHQEGKHLEQIREPEKEVTRFDLLDMD